jgi:K+-transporting ATPase KdpC subunit
LEFNMKSDNGNLHLAHPEAPAPQQSVTGLILRELRVSVVAIVALAVIVCGIYPAVVWGLANVLFRHQASGSLIGKDGQPVSDEKLAVGSTLIGQNFSDARYFHLRPSSAGSGYDPTASGGSNLGPTSAKLMNGTTKDFAYTIFAADKSPAAVVPVSGRVQGSVVAVTKTSIELTPQPNVGPKTGYALDPAVADPNTVINYHGRTVHATSIPVGAMVELKLNDKTPQAVTAINVADQEIEGGVSTADTTANKITLNDSSNTVLNVDPKNTVFVVNGKSDAKLDAITPGMAVHAIVALQMDYDGVANRVVHYCQDNNIGYKASVPDSDFTDADGIDDMKLNTAFNAASNATISPEKPIPADAVTASGSGLDPHISIANAKLQADRVAKARGASTEKVLELLAKYTDEPQLGLFGDGGVNALRLNLALDQALPVPTTQPGK